MSKRKVFVIWNHPLFFESVRLLLQDNSIEWVGACRNNEDAGAQIVGIHPDTILIEEMEDGDTPARVIDLLETRSAPLRIFRMSLHNNDLLIYRKEHRTVAQANDLLHIIRSSK